MFCKACGKQIPDDSKVCQYCGVTLVVQPMNSTENVNQADLMAEQPKKPLLKKIIAIISVVLVLAIIASSVLFLVLRKKEEVNSLFEVLEKYTDKQIVSYIYEDFDDNGTEELYAVVGEVEIKDDYEEYYDSDIYFVSDKEAKVINVGVSGHSNGVIEVEDRIYVSYEIYDNGKEQGFSYVYSVELENPVKSDISGKYSDVHQNGGKIFAKDEDGEKVEIKIDLSKNTVISYYLEPTEEDWETYNEFLCATSLTFCDFDSESEKAYDQAHAFISGYFGSEIYGYFFGYEAEERIYSDKYDESSGKHIFSNKDPLNRLTKTYSYCRYSADSIDWIIKNVFGLKVDREYSNERCYYHGDYFYLSVGDGGDLPREFETNGKKLSDGRYKAVSIGSYGVPDYFEEINIDAVVGLIEVDGKRIWTISKFIVNEDGSSEETVVEESTTVEETTKAPAANSGNGLAKYLGNTYSAVFRDFGEAFIKDYYEGGQFIVYNDDNLWFGTFDGETINEIKNEKVRTVFAWENQHLCGSFYANMSYKQLKAIIPDLPEPEFMEMDETYWLSFEYEGYGFAYEWFDKPSADTKSDMSAIQIYN